MTLTNEGEQSPVRRSSKSPSKPVESARKTSASHPSNSNQGFYRIVTRQSSPPIEANGVYPLRGSIGVSRVDGRSSRVENGVETGDATYRNARVTGKVHQRILEHATVTGGEHEAVAVEPLGVLRVVRHRLAENDIAHRGAAHRETRVTGVALVDGVDGEETNGVDAIIDRFSLGAGRGGDGAGSSANAGAARGLVRSLVLGREVGRGAELVRRLGDGGHHRTVFSRESFVSFATVVR